MVDPFLLLSLTEILPLMLFLSPVLKAHDFHSYTDMLAIPALLYKVYNGTSFKWHSCISTELKREGLHIAAEVMLVS